MRPCHAVCLLTCLMVAPAFATIGGPFVPVFIDQATVAALGPFPFDRSVYAKAIDQAVKFGVKGVVLDILFFSPGSAKGDQAFQQAIGKTKVVLEASIDDSFKSPPNPLPDRFILWDLPTGRCAIEGTGGILPLPSFAAAAADVGFVNTASAQHVPVIEEYRGACVKSISLCCVELALGQTARVEPGVQMTIAGKTVALDAQSQAVASFPRRDHIEHVSLGNLLSGNVFSDQFKDRVVVIMYDIDGMPLVQSPLGPIKPGHLFFYQTRSLYEQVRKD
jgi:CHASE2 domain